MPISGDVQANLEERLRLIRIAASEGAQIIAFPELSLTGYELEIVHDVAFLEYDQRLAPLIEASASSSTILVVGAPVCLGSRLHIGAFIVQPDEMISLYTKQHFGAFSEAAACDGTVPPGEATVFIPGDRNPLVPVGGNAAAFAICADIGQSSHPQQAADRGAKVYVAGMFIIPSEFEREASKLKGYAKRHSMAVALANFGATTGGLATAGHSSIWSGSVELLIRLDANGAGVAIATETQEGWRAKEIMLSDLRSANSV